MVTSDGPAETPASTTSGSGASAAGCPADAGSGSGGSGDEALTVAATATAVNSLHWALSSLFKLFVAWAGDAGAERGDVAVWLSATGRHMGEQAAGLRALMPDSVLLADSTKFSAPSAESAEVFVAVREIDGAAVRLAVALRVLLAAVSDFCDSLAQVA